MDTLGDHRLEEFFGDELKARERTLKYRAARSLAPETVAQQ
jgi:hypothetical protein